MQVYRRPEDRMRFLLGRLLAYNVLYREHGLVDPEFAATAYGRPVICRPARSVVDFNISHAGDWVACATTRAGLVGLDIVRTADFADWPDFAAEYLSPAEFGFIRSREEPATGRLAARFWAAKEAVLKATGTGFFCDPRALVFDLSDRVRLVSAPAFLDGHRFAMAETSPAPGCYACVALSLAPVSGGASELDLEDAREPLLEIKRIVARSLIRAAAAPDTEGAGLVPTTRPFSRYCPVPQPIRNER